VAVAKLPSLKRLCFESCDLQELDLSGNPNLADIRAALNSFSEIKMGGGTGPKIWHWCIRDNPQLTQNFQDVLTNFYALQELWVWNANQSGALTFVSTNLTDVEIYNNYYTSADFSGQSNLQFLWAENNYFTNLVLTGCSGLLELRAQNNLLDTPVLDALLTVLDTSAPDLQLVNLMNNAGLPSSVGYSHYASLTNRGVNVYVDFPDPNGPIIVLDSAELATESCSPGNNAIDPGETATVSFAFKNIGGADTSDIMATLLEINGVLSPSGPQNYGALLAGGKGANQSFSFTASGACGASIFATFQLQDGATALGPILVPLSLGQDIAVFSQNFDAVTRPALPSGWTSSATGGQSPWVSANFVADTTPNAGFSPDPPEPGINELVSPPIALPATQARLTFRNNYDLEPDLGTAADDGGVLEIQIGANSFTDILAAGGTFLSGGYTGIITNLWGNPLAGRKAWSGNSGGYITTVVNLPAAAQGQTIRLSWRCATDNGNGGSFGGWSIDTVAITTGQCCTGEAIARTRQ
jgi:hypothetical protein